MKDFSCWLSPQELKNLLTCLEKYKAKGTRSGIIFFGRYKNVTITVYRINKVLFQGRDVDRVVNELLPGKIGQILSPISEDELIKQKERKAAEEQFQEKLRNVVTSTEKTSYVLVSDENDQFLTLVARFNHLTNERKIDSDKIAIFTHKRHLADKLIQKLFPKKLDNTNTSVPIFTFSSFCSKFLKKNASDETDNHMMIIDTNEKAWVIDKCFETLKIVQFELSKEEIGRIIKYQTLYDLPIESAINYVNKTVSKQKNFAQIKEKVQKIFGEYNRITAELNWFDFEKLTKETDRKLVKNPSLAKEQWTFFLISDFQKADQIQKEILALLIPDLDKLFVVEKEIKPHTYHWKRLDVTKKLLDRLNNTKIVSLKRDEFFPEKEAHGNGFSSELNSSQIKENMVSESNTDDNSLTEKTKHEVINFKHKHKYNSWSKSKYLSENGLIEIGCDEVGTGGYFGGIVTATVALLPGQMDLLSTHRIRDSKLIKEHKEIFQIVENLNPTIRYQVTELTPTEYNLKYSVFKNENIVKAVTHNETLINLINNNEIALAKSKIVMDEFTEKQKYYRYLNEANVKTQIEITDFAKHAESKFISVALASIIARYHFLKQIQQLSEEIGLKIPLGSSKVIVSIRALEIFQKFGFASLKNFVKVHFCTTNEVRKMDNIFKKKIIIK